MTRSGDRLARFAVRASSNISRILSASQLGVTLASLGLGWVAESTVGDMFANVFGYLPFAMEMSLRLTLGAALALVVVTYLHVVFGELTPKAAALNHPEALARWLAPPLLFFAWITTPFTYSLNKSSQAILRLLGQEKAGSEDAVHSPEEIRLLVEQSQESGQMQAHDADLIDAVFEFSEKNAREVMTPRTELVALPVEATLSEVLGVVQESGLSRYPVYDESIDNIIGVVLAKDLLKLLAPRANTEAFDLPSIMRPVHVIPGSREILDEYDTSEDEEAPLHTRAGETLVPGSTHIGELNEHFSLTVPDEDYTTIGGYVFGVLGRLPVVGDRVIAGGAIFTVREMDGRRIETLAVDLHTMGDRRTGDRETQSTHTEA
jgi:CBS domain containing-hemolysin-like protein